MLILFLITVQLNARIPQKLASWTLSYVDPVVSDFDLKLLKMVQNDSSYPRTLVLPQEPCL